jgi:predicted metal-dependent HD superfamily phosphohydrolase
VYGEPHRAYHTARHVGACLELLADPAVAALATNVPEVEAAIWFHDAVYDTHASDNEERSATMAAKILGAARVAPEAIARVADHIRATHHHSATTPDAALVVDVDLSILGADAETFARFEDEIRREYAWVPAEQFTAGRAAVLRGFAEREHIYATPLFRDRLEARARENLARRLAELSA